MARIWEGVKLLEPGKIVTCLISLIVPIRKAQVRGLVVRSGKCWDLGLNTLVGGVDVAGVVAAWMGIKLLDSSDGSFSSNRSIRSRRAESPPWRNA